MPAWLIEGDATIYLLLGFGFIVCLVAWQRTRKRHFAIAAGVFAALILGYFLLDRFIESDGEQMTRKGPAPAGAPGIKRTYSKEGVSDDMVVKNLLEDIAAFGIAVLIATHNVEIVTRLRRRVLTLVEGRLVRDQPAGQTGRMAWLASS